MDFRLSFFGQWPLGVGDSGGPDRMRYLCDSSADSLVAPPLIKSAKVLAIMIG